MLLAGLAAILRATQSGSDAQPPTRRDLINGKLAANGYPTVSEDEYGTSEALVGATPERSDGAAAPATATPEPFPTSCAGGAIAGGDEIIASYGSLGNCGVLGGYVVITTLGGPLGSGIGIYECAPDDAECLSKRAPAAPAEWRFYPSPDAGPVRILAFRPPTTIVINEGAEMCFDFETLAYTSSGDCQ